MPIVASDIHGFKRVVERNVQGILVEPRNRARSLRRSTPSRAMPTCATTWARPVARAEFSWDRVTERIVDFYYETRERVLARR